jgi:signal transduction histidine kinase
VKSIRTYLLTRLLGGAALSLAAAGAGVYFVATRAMERQFDRNLADRVQGFASMLFQVKDHVEFEFSDQLMPEYEPGAAPDYFELRFADGRPLERSNSLAGRSLGALEAAGVEPVFWTAALPDGREGRYVAQRIEVHHVYPEEGPDRPQAALVAVTVARGREDLVAAERLVLLDCIALPVVLMALIGALVWTAVARGLEPASRLAAALDEIHLDRPPRELGVGAMPRELAPVAEKADALIDRVHRALERERRTAADIAHELRNPIGELLTVSEVALRNGRDAESTRKALSTVRDVAWRMGRSVATLLELARLEMGAGTFERQTVDVGSIVRETLRSLAALQRERDLKVESRVAAGATVEADADVLCIVVSNLLSNAVYYSPPGGAIECRLEGERGPWRFWVANDAGDLGPEDLRSLSEPFWRKDRARSDRDRSGLGLALSRALAERAGLSLSFEIEAGRFRAIVAGEATAPARARRNSNGAR